MSATGHKESQTLEQQYDVTDKASQVASDETGLYSEQIKRHARQVIADGRIDFKFAYQYANDGSLYAGATMWVCDNTTYTMRDEAVTALSANSEATNDGRIMNLYSYDKYIVAFSGGKDSMACFLHLLECGIPKEKIELWHHLIDGKDDLFMDWACTEDYCRKFAQAFDVPIYFSWKVGGFRREMLRRESLTAPTQFETPTGQIKECGGKTGKVSTRMKFPQVSPDLSVRWCSAYLKIDVCSSAIRNQERFNHSRTLVISGERGEESPARAKYAIFEPDRADNRSGKAGRHVDRLRPVRDWTEAQVWGIIRRHGIRSHPAYDLGFGRVSCLYCIFGNANQFATAVVVDSNRFINLREYEEEFDCTVKRNESLIQLASKGKPYDASSDQSLLEQSRSRDYEQPIFTNDWTLPAGAFGESCGPV